MIDAGDDQPRRQLPGEPVGRRAVVEPDRRVGDAALRGGRAAGAGHGRRAPGRGRDRRARRRPTAAPRSTSRCGSSDRRSTRSRRRSRSDDAVAAGARRHRGAPELAEFRAEVDARGSRRTRSGAAPTRATSSNEVRVRRTRPARSELAATSRRARRGSARSTTPASAGLTRPDRVRRPRVGERWHERDLPPGVGPVRRSTPACSRCGLGMVVPTILGHGTEEQKQQHVPPLLRGDAGLVPAVQRAGRRFRPRRPHHAGRAATATTWIVNGQKVWNSCAHVADWGILLARTDWDVPKHRGITYFLVDMTTPGVEARPLRQITGVAHFNETFLTDVHIPHANLLGAPQRRLGRRPDDAHERARRSSAAAGWAARLPRLRRAGAPLRRSSTIPTSASASPRLYTRVEILKWLGAARAGVGACGQADRGPRARWRSCSRPCTSRRTATSRSRSRAPTACSTGSDALRGRLLAADVPRPVGDPHRRRHRAGAAQHPRRARPRPPVRAAPRQDRRLPGHPEERVTPRQSVPA